MYKDKKVLALIPARGGSKGIPGKNIKLLCGHPLIAYTISAARKSRYIDDVVVTTDSEDIAAAALRYGAEVPFLRPAELSGDTSRSIDALVHARDVLTDLGREYDSIVFMQPTSPLRHSREVDEAIEVFYSHGSLGLASVVEVTENPLLTRSLGESGVLHPIIPVSSTVRRQEMPKFYHVSGAIYINSAAQLSSETSLNDNPIAYIMERDQSIDIDSLEDFMRAEQILSGLDEIEPVCY